jgi:hypothetical protein
MEQGQVASVLIVIAMLFLLWREQIRSRQRFGRRVLLVSALGVLCAAAVLILVGCAHGADSEGTSLPDAVEQTTQFVTKRVADGKRLCGEQPLTFTAVAMTQKSRPRKGRAGEHMTSQRVVERPVVLCAFDQTDNSWHVIHLRTRVPGLKPPAPFVFRVITPGYRVEHVEGRGIVRLAFRVTRVSNDAELTVYAMKHAWIPGRKIGEPITHPERAQSVVVAAYNQTFRTRMIVDGGAAFLQSKIIDALEELRDNGVSSRAYPGKLVSDVISWRHIFVIALIEQMDAGKFLNDPIGTTEEALVRYQLNGADAFRYSMSPKNAIGPMQFTDKNGKGTYSLVVSTYPDARLPRSFEDGARDLAASIRASACLLDLELSRLPGSVRALFNRDPRVGGIYPIAAYNEGWKGALRLFELITQHGIDLSVDDLELPKDVFVRKRVDRVRQSRNGRVIRRVHESVNGETYLYLQKYFLVWEYAGS